MTSGPWRLRSAPAAGVSSSRKSPRFSEPGKGTSTCSKRRSGWRANSGSPARQRISGDITAIVDQHPLINLLDWYQQLKLIADNVAKAPTRGNPMEVVRPVDNRVGSRVLRETR